MVPVRGIHRGLGSKALAGRGQRVQAGGDAESGHYGLPGGWQSRTEHEQREQHVQPGSEKAGHFWVWQAPQWDGATLRTHTSGHTREHLPHDTASWISFQSFSHHLLTSPFLDLVPSPAHSLLGNILLAPRVSGLEEGPHCSTRCPGVCWPRELEGITRASGSEAHRCPYPGDGQARKSRKGPKLGPRKLWRKYGIYRKGGTTESNHLLTRYY